MTPEAKIAAHTDTVGETEEDTVLDAHVGPRDDVETKDLQNIGIIWAIACGWLAGSTLGAALGGPVGAGVGGAIGGYIGAHDPWLQ